jgi:dGTPase
MRSDRSQRLSGQESRHKELRTEFQRDRDRILYSAQFRRLGGITQVTTPSELFAFHNRLTHTLEVAQISRRIAERAVTTCPGSESLIDPDVCEAAALAHDLGHPPFGHNGERVLDRLARDENKAGGTVMDGFEGNAQSLRILLKLAVRNSDQRGLDLTVATLRASIKYPWLLRDASSGWKGKFGVYETEAVEFAKLWNGMPFQRQTLEAEIMDWADDVAYSTHDFYDFALAGLIPISQLRSANHHSLRSILVELEEVSGLPDEAFDRVSQSFSLLPEQPMQDTSRLTSTTVGMLKEWVSAMISRFAGHGLHFCKTAEGVAFKKTQTIQQEVAIVKAVTTQYAIASPALAVRHEGERRVLTTLFEIMSTAASDSRSKLLSEDSRKRIDSGDPPVRVVLDAISSMTDAQAISMFHKFTGIAPISVLDLTTPSAL